MKLNKDTKYSLQSGMILRFPDGSTYTVLSVFPMNRGINITVRCDDGRYIYCTPSSGFYGAEMLEKMD